jgi:hypothetical protein
MGVERIPFVEAMPFETAFGREPSKESRGKKGGGRK